MKIFRHKFFDPIFDEDKLLWLPFLTNYLDRPEDLDKINQRIGITLKSKLIELQRFSINVHPRLEDVNLAYKDLVLYRKWTRVAILYTGKRDGR